MAAPTHAAISRWPVALSWRAARRQLRTLHVFSSANEVTIPSQLSYSRDCAPMIIAEGHVVFPLQLANLHACL